MRARRIVTAVVADRFVRRALIAALAAGVLLPAVALARRRASHNVHRQLVSAAVKAGDLSRSQGRCTHGYISTVNRNYAELTFIPGCSTSGDGISLYHHVHGHWKFVTAGSSFSCPIRGIPTRVAHDLKAC